MTPDDLKAWRSSLGLSQRAAATAHSVTLATYQTWERGADWDGKPLTIKPAVSVVCEKISRESPNLTKSPV